MYATAPWGLASRKEDPSIGTKRGADVARNPHLCSLSVSRGVSALPPALYFCGLLPAYSSSLTMLRGLHLHCPPILQTLAVCKTVMLYL